MTDPIIDEDLSGIPDRFPEVDFQTSILTRDEFIDDIAAYTTPMDVLTYSVGSVPVGMYVGRLIYVHGPLGPGIHKSKQVVGNHAKLWIAYGVSGRPIAYVGSMNLGLSHQFQLMVRLNQADSKGMKRWFDRLWDKLPDEKTNKRRS